MYLPFYLDSSEITCLNWIIVYKTCAKDLSGRKFKLTDINSTLGKYSKHLAAQIT